ncbi:MAG: hypothetical protein U0Z44_13425 [Kouleothrix sp.]
MRRGVRVRPRCASASRRRCCRASSTAGALRAGAQVFFDPAPSFTCWHRRRVYALAAADIILLTEEVAIASPEGAPTLLAHSRVVVVKRGAAGCRIWTHNGTFDSPGFPVVARDVASGRLLRCGVRVWPPERLGPRAGGGAEANATGAAKVQKRGTGRQAPPDEVRAVLQPTSPACSSSRRSAIALYSTVFGFRALPKAEMAQNAGGRRLYEYEEGLPMQQHESGRADHPGRPAAWGARRRRALAPGARLALLDRDEARVALAHELAARGYPALALAADVADEPALAGRCARRGAFRPARRSIQQRWRRRDGPARG